MKTSINTILFLFTCFELFSQVDPVADFSFPLEVCTNEPGNFRNESSNALTLEWDFCDKDFDGVSSVNLLGMLNGLGRTLGVDIVNFEGNWFGFVTSWDQNKIYRLWFGNGLKNPPTEVVDLGNPSNMLNQPVSIHVVFRLAKWYLLIHNWGTSSISRVDIGADLLNTSISAVTMVSSVGGFPVKMDVVDTHEELKAALIQANGSIRIINFKNDLDLSVTTSDVVNTPPIASISSARDLALIKKDDNWFAFVSSFNPVAVYRLEFGANVMDGLINTPIQIAGANFQGRINNIEITKSGLAYYLHVLTLEGGLFKIILPIITSIPSIENIIQYGQSVDYKEGYVFKFVKDQGNWRGFTFQDNLGATPKLYGISSEFDCGQNVKFSEEINPIVSYSKPGTYPVTLNAVSEDGHTSVITKEITVTNNQAPSIDFSVSTFCETSPVTFNASSDQTLMSHYWSFGDSNTSAEGNPGHQYSSSGEYTVSLEAEATNGCSNFRQKEIIVYKAPISDFTLPPNLICTNNAFIFPNNTPDTFDGNLSYQWYVDDIPVSTERDLTYAFTTTEPKQIKLQTSLPGCSTDIVKITLPVEAGPVVDFSFTGTCEGETFNFQHEISESVQAYFWDFDDGNSSSEPDPSNTFSEFGDYSVSLTATNSIGCQNKKTKIISVRAKPTLDFEIPGPPYSCTGTPTQFYNLSLSPDGSGITAWLWDFNDPDKEALESARDPQYIFENAGPYNVSLTATTEFGCQATVQKEMVIARSPSTDFTFTPACDDLPVLFSGPTGSDIQEWYWEMGTAYYTTSSPTHTFRTPGDYPVLLDVTGSNGCSSSITRTIHVPEPLQPDFSFLKNCIDQPAIFTDITSGVDPVISREWDFDGLETSTQPSAIYSFQQGGNKTIKLKVTAQSGCSYQISKQVVILPAPEANFSPAPPSGAQPLEVHFTNTSSQATQYLWKFSDGTGSISTEESPVYTFEDVGQYVVELTASNAQQCEDTFVAVISTVAPLPDVDLEMISVTLNPDGTFKLIVTINNKGNTILKNLAMDFDFSGALNLREMVQDPIEPASKYNMVFSPGISNLESLRYLCVSADLADDLSPEGNRSCKEFENILYVFPAYPNPAKDLLNLELIGEKESAVRISLFDPMGRKVLAAEFMVDQGLNQEAIDIRMLQNGIYMLLIDDGFTKSTQRVLISGKQ